MAGARRPRTSSAAAGPTFWTGRGEMELSRVEASPVPWVKGEDPDAASATDATPARKDIANDFRPIAGVGPGKRDLSGPTVYFAGSARLGETEGGGAGDANPGRARVRRGRPDSIVRRPSRRWIGREPLRTRGRVDCSACVPSRPTPPSPKQTNQPTNQSTNQPTNQPTVPPPDPLISGPP